MECTLQIKKLPSPCTKSITITTENALIYSICRQFVKQIQFAFCQFLLGISTHRIAICLWLTYFFKGVRVLTYDRCFIYSKIREINHVDLKKFKFYLKLKVYENKNSKREKERKTVFMEKLLESWKMFNNHPKSWNSGFTGLRLKVGWTSIFI